MFDKKFFDELPERIQHYFEHFPDTNRVAVLIGTNDTNYLLVDTIEYDERFVTFTHWPLSNADLPARWSDVKDSLAAVIISYEDIRSVEFNPKIARGKEIGFTRDTP